MSAVYVIYSPENRAFVEKRLICPLPALGFDRWIPARMLAQAGATMSPEIALQQGAAILVVLPATASVTTSFRHEVERALAGSGAVIPVYLGARNTPRRDAVLADLEKRACIDASAEHKQSDPRELSNALARLLPPPTASATRDDPTIDVSAPIGWNEELFSALLAEALGRQDFFRSDALVAALARHLADGAYAYGTQHANTDLAALRKKRQFLLMRRYASAVIDSGATDFKVRRQYAQALIELKDFDSAKNVLTPLVEETTAAKHGERYEARGLMGRLLKQGYVDAPSRRNHKLLAQAIDAYRSAFREDEQNVWHGINAASCLLRARRDGVATASPREARAIAKQVLKVLARRQARAKSKQLDVWDYATRVEALVALDDFRKAGKALNEYLVHPDMEAFEVSSTYRQFDELLQLGKNEKGRPLVDRLARAAERLRNGGSTGVDDTSPKPMLVHVSDPDWAPMDVPDLVIHSRLGPIVSVTGSDATIRSLLKDPLVISFEASRPSGVTECLRSVPLVRVGSGNTFNGAGGTYTECGGSALVAVIDDGIDVLHEAFLDGNGQSRIIGIWDQQDPDASSPPPGFDFGRYHNAADIADYVAKKKPVPASLSRANDGHGTHVASIAAGRKVGKFGGGVAPDAQLLIVITKADEPVGYSHTHLNALTFIKQTAESLGKPVVVNVSQGMNAGAHDGRSPLELAFDAFSNRGTLPGLVIVKSAGNERSKRGHAKLTVPDKGKDKLIWRCPPGPSSTVTVELWCRTASAYRFLVKSPTGQESEWVEEANPSVEDYFKKHGDYSVKFVKRHPEHPDSSLLRVTVTTGVSPVASNDWTLRVEAIRVVKNHEIHAWIERNDQTKVEFVNHDNEEMTLTIPGTSDSVITVGAIDPDATLSNGEFAVEVGDFSSYGPTRDGRPKPDISAPGVKISAAKRDSTSDVVELCGTSMAAPHVTGAIALLLSKRASQHQVLPTAAQIGSVLRDKTINWNGDWDPGSGFGVLDVAALLSAF
jgi:subtilisin family serine protease